MSLAEVLPNIESLCAGQNSLDTNPGSAARTRSGRNDRSRQVLSASIARPGVYGRRGPPASLGRGQRPAMSTPAQQFPYVRRDPSLGQASLAPILPLTLIGRQSIATDGLVDSGAAVNVLPYALGVQLGFDWEQQPHSVELSGNLAAVEVRRGGPVRGSWQFSSGSPGLCLGAD